MEIPLTVAGAARQIAAKQISPVELAAPTSTGSDASMHTWSFLLVTEERALADARAAEARIMRDGPKGLLDGIPIGYKDIYNTAGIPTTGNSRLLADNVPVSDATAVTRLAEAGTVMLGKLANSEFAMGGSFDLPWPPPKNPWNLIVPRADHRAEPAQPWRLAWSWVGRVPKLPARSAPLPRSAG